MSLVSTAALLNRIAAAGLLALGCAAHAQGVAQAATTTPPPGTMTGAYGQSLQQQAAAVDKGVAAKPAQAGTAGDAVSRFLSERGLTMQGIEDGGLLTVTGGNGEDYGVAGIFHRLIDLPDAIVMEIITVVIGVSSPGRGPRPRSL